MPPAVRVLFTIPALGFGGSERVMLNLLRHIDRRQFEPHLAVLESRGGLLQDVPPHVPIHELGATRARRAVPAIIELCKNLEPVAILSTSAHLNVAVISARPFLPKRTALLTREGTAICSPQVTRSRIRFLAYKYAYKCSDLVICQSDHMRENMIFRFRLAPSKVRRIYNPVDIDSIQSLSALEGNPFPRRGPNLLAVGRLSREKDFDLLLRSFPQVLRVFPNASLTFVGSGPDGPSLERSRDRLGLSDCVSFLEACQNPYHFLKHADLLVLTSRYEGLPNVILEAIALGTPVVATNCTGALSEISSCTRHIAIVDSRQPEAISAAVISSLNKANPGSKGIPEREFVQRFHIATIVREYEEALSNVRVRV